MTEEGFVVWIGLFSLIFFAWVTYAMIFDPTQLTYLDNIIRGIFQ